MKFSNCCNAISHNGICSECKEHCGEYECVTTANDVMKINQGMKVERLKRKQEELKKNDEHKSLIEFYDSIIRNEMRQEWLGAM